jgi:hypothetical protein
MQAHAAESSPSSFDHFSDNTIAERVSWGDPGCSTMDPPSCPSSPAVSTIIPDTWTDPLFQRWVIWYAKSPTSPGEEEVER